MRSALLLAGALVLGAASVWAAEPQTATPPAPVDICLTNACSTPGAKAGAEATAPTRTGPPADAAPGSFAARFNGNSPVLLRGKLIGFEPGDPFTYLRMTDENGRLYRVEGGPASTMNPQMRAAYESAVGTEVTVRGYNAWEPGCDRGCLVNGRDVTMPAAQVGGAGRPPG